MRMGISPSRMLLLVLMAAVLALCPGVAQSYLKQASLLPQWIPQAQFAGYLVAKEKGFYRDARIDLTLLQGGPGKDPYLTMAAGKATYSTGWLSTAIERRASGIRLVNLAQIMQRSALLLVALKKSGIRKVGDLNGRKVGYWVGEFYVPARVFFGKHNLHVKIIPNYTSITIFSKHAVDAIGAMWYNEYHSILNSGYDPDELTVFRMGDLGVDFPEDGLYCMEATFKADPEMCEAFVQASLRGWLYAFDHREEALDIVMEYANAANTGTNRAHQAWMLARMRDLILPEGDRASLGKLDPKDYLTVRNALKTLYLIDRLPAFKEFYRGKK